MHAHQWHLLLGLQVAIFCSRVVSCNQVLAFGISFSICKDKKKLSHPSTHWGTVSSNTFECSLLKKSSLYAYYNKHRNYAMS